jgi:hypothetical protein
VHPGLWTPSGSGSRPRRRNVRRWIVVGVVVVVIGLVTTAVWLDIQANPPPPFCPSQLTGRYQNASVLYTAAPCQSTINLPANSFKVYLLFAISDRMTLLGGYVASSAVGAYLVNSTEISVVDSNPHPTAPPAQYFWSSGIGLNCTIALAIPAAPQQFYLVVENLNAQALSVRWAQPLLLVVVSNH